MSDNLFSGATMRVTCLANGMVELCFDRQGAPINKFDKATVEDLRQSVAAIAADSSVRGVLVTSAKDAFIVGADITEFGAMFRLPGAEIVDYVVSVNKTFSAVEQLPVPVVAAINGLALGGGLEMALTADYRVMSNATQIGLPEVKLGLIPGFGGTVRLPRVASAATAIDWITSGRPNKADVALAAGAVDQVVAPEVLRAAALELLAQCVAGKQDWRARRAVKQGPVSIEAEAAKQLFATAKAEVKKKSPRHQPAALTGIELIERAAPLGFDAALRGEADVFAGIARSQAASGLVQIFLNEQALKKINQQYVKRAQPLKQGAVLGAGIMGGGIAYTSAAKGTPVLMKDIAQAQLDLGTREATKLLAKQVKNGKLKQEKADAILASIKPQLDYAGFDGVDVVIEAVVENIGVKHKVLAELEGVIRADAVIATNTSSLRIDDLAVPLKRPQNFVGMHFFNPVPVMPLVEIIKGSKTGDAALAAAVGYAVAMGKTPIVVKDCPGFLVNRILTAYLIGFYQLVADGADFVEIDRVMETFGWPMGPARLNDVIGMDTAAHVYEVISAGYPDRMPLPGKNVIALMAEHKRFGQKNGIGFFRYEVDADGKPQRLPAQDSYTLLGEIQPKGTRKFADEEIVERMMLPLIVESARALEEGVVGTAAEIDMALLLGISLPAYLGGALKYADWLGLDKVVALCQKHAAIGPIYRPTAKMRAMAASGARYYA